MRGHTNTRPAGRTRAVAAAALPVLAMAVRACSCGHAKQAHEHYRRGSDCALCSCGRFSRPLLRLLTAPGR